MAIELKMRQKLAVIIDYFTLITFIDVSINIDESYICQY